MEPGMCGQILSMNINLDNLAVGDFRMSGTVVSVSEAKTGFTFVIRVGDEPRLMKRNRWFAHSSDLIDAWPVKVGDRVEFLPNGPDRPGQLPHARDVRFESCTDNKQ
jgi:hypothetical protein